MHLFSFLLSPPFKLLSLSLYQTSSSTTQSYYLCDLITLEVPFNWSQTPLQITQTLQNLPLSNLISDWRYNLFLYVCLHIFSSLGCPFVLCLLDDTFFQLRNRLEDIPFMESAPTTQDRIDYCLLGHLNPTFISLITFIAFVLQLHYVWLLVSYEFHEESNHIDLYTLIACTSAVLIYRICCVNSAQSCPSLFAASMVSSANLPLSQSSSSENLAG